MWMQSGEVFWGEGGLSHATSVSPPEAAATTVLRSSMSISIPAAARSMQHHNWADGSRSFTADVSRQMRDLMTRHSASGALKNVCVNAVSFFNTFVFKGLFYTLDVFHGSFQDMKQIEIVFVRHSIRCGGRVAQTSTDSSLKQEPWLIRSEDYHMLTHSHTASRSGEDGDFAPGISWMNSSSALI